MSARQVFSMASPWTARQRLLLGVLLAVGLAGLVIGYVGSSGTLRLSEQVVWINLAGAGLLVSGAGVAVFLTVGRRAVGRRRRVLFGDVAEDVPSLALSAAGGSPGQLVAAPAMTRYHRADCGFVAGKPGVAPATAMDHERAGRRPCGVCLPEVTCE